MEPIVELIDEVISNIDNQSAIESVKTRVNEMMSGYPLFGY